MDITKIRAYLTAIDTGSLTRAAEQLNYTPSALSRMMSSMEQEAGMALLVRFPRGVTPTAAAAELIPAMRRLTRDDEELAQMVSRLNGLQTGHLAIGTYTSIAERWLPPVIKRFAADYPNVDIELREGIGQELDGLLAEGRVDLCFCSHRKDYQGDWFPLADDPLLAVVPVTHPAARQSSYRLEDCGGEALIMASAGADCDVLEVMRSSGLHPNVRYSTYEDYAALALIECGLGIGVMNELITKRHDANVVKLPLNPPQAITMGIAIPSLENATPVARRFIDYALEMMTDLGKPMARA